MKKYSIRILYTLIYFCLLTKIISIEFLKFPSKSYKINSESPNNNYYTNYNPYSHNTQLYPPHLILSESNHKLLEKFF